MIVKVFAQAADHQGRVLSRHEGDLSDLENLKNQVFTEANRHLIGGAISDRPHVGVGTLTVSWGELDA